MADENDHYDGVYKPDGNRRNRMGVEYLKEFNIRGDQIDKIALILCLKFCRAEFPQSGKDLMPEQGEKAERNIMVAAFTDMGAEIPRTSRTANPPKTVINVAARFPRVPMRMDRDM